MVDLPFSSSGPFTTALSNYPSVYSPTNGNPGGYIFLVDPGSSRVFYFQAPAAYLGNRSNYYGGALSFDIKREHGSLLNFVDLVLVGGGFTFVADAGAGPNAGVWTNYTLPLSEAGGWKKDTLTGATPTAAEFRGLLGNLSALRIRGEYSTSSGDTGMLDNVSMSLPLPPALSVGRSLSNGLQLCWNSKTGTVYQVQSLADLNGKSWTNIPTLLVPGNGSNLCTVVASTNGSEQYFRVVESP